MTTFYVYCYGDHHGPMPLGTIELTRKEAKAHMKHGKPVVLCPTLPPLTVLTFTRTSEQGTATMLTKGTTNALSS